MASCFEDWVGEDEGEGAWRKMLLLSLSGFTLMMKRMNENSMHKQKKRAVKKEFPSFDQHFEVTNTYIPLTNGEPKPNMIPYGFHNATMDHQNDTFASEASEETYANVSTPSLILHVEEQPELIHDDASLSNSVESNDENPEQDNLIEFLRNWALKCNISHEALTDLLRILRQHSCFKQLPSDVRGLMKRPTSPTISQSDFQRIVLSQLTTIKQEIKDTKSMVARLIVQEGITTENIPVPFSLPVDTMDRLKDMEDKIATDEQVKMNLITILCTCGGSSAEEFLKRILKKIIVDEIAAQFSLYGKKGKLPFIKLLPVLCTSIKSAVRKSITISDSDFEKNMSRLLVNAGDRIHKLIKRQILEDTLESKQCC